MGVLFACRHIRMSLCCCLPAQVHCCAESLLVLTSQHIPHTLQPHHAQQRQEARSPHHTKATGTPDSMLQQTQRQAKQHKRQDKASREALAPAGSDAPADLPGPSPNSRTGMVWCCRHCKVVCATSTNMAVYFSGWHLEATCSGTPSVVNVV